MQKKGSQVKEDMMGRLSFKTVAQMWDISLLIYTVRYNLRVKRNLRETLGDVAGLGKN